MKFLKQIFRLDDRLDRKGYLLLGKLPMVFTTLVFFFLLGLFFASKLACGGKKKIVNFTCVEMSIVSLALMKFKLDNSVYPTTTEGFEALVSNPDIVKYPNYSPSEYLKTLPIDAWGTKMILKLFLMEQIEKKVGKMNVLMFSIRSV